MWGCWVIQIGLVIWLEVNQGTCAVDELVVWLTAKVCSAGERARRGAGAGFSLTVVTHSSMSLEMVRWDTSSKSHISETTCFWTEDMLSHLVLLWCCSFLWSKGRSNSEWVLPHLFSCMHTHLSGAWKKSVQESDPDLHSLPWAFLFGMRSPISSTERQIKQGSSLQCLRNQKSDLRLEKNSNPHLLTKPAVWLLPCGHEGRGHCKGSKAAWPERSRVQMWGYGGKEARM